MKSKLNPYLVFPSQCEEAMTFYQSILGGKLTLSRYSDMPEMHAVEAQKDMIIHALLENDSLTLMGSDDNEEQKSHKGNNVHLSISGTDDAALSEYFQKLSAGGEVQMPLEKAPWGDKFGMLTDKFGIHWMINITSEQK